MGPNKSRLATRFGVLILLSWLICLPLSAKPLAQKGLIDLSDWDFIRDGTIELNGEWYFYWGRHLDREQIRLDGLRGSEGSFVEVPDNWNRNDQYPSQGFATYRLEILMSDLKPLALKLRTVGTAYRLFVDGKEVASVGRPGQSAITTTPFYQPKIVTFVPQSTRVEVIIFVTNFHHRNAGLWEAIELGDPELLREAQLSRLATDFVLFGAIVMMGLYNLITWMTRRENVSGLWLGLFCLAISTRILLVDERFINQIIPELPWALLTRFEYITWFVSLPFFLAFIRSMFPTETSVLVLRCLAGLATGFTVLAMVLPIVHATSLVPPYQVVTLVSMAYGAYCLGLAMWRRKDGSFLFGFGALFLFLAAISDLITVVFTLDTDHQLQFGLFMFVLMLSIQVSVRSSRAFQTVEAQSSELRKTNLELHIQEKLRRAAEGESQALHQRVSQSTRTFNFGLVAEAVVRRRLEESAKLLEQEQALDTSEIEQEAQEIDAVSQTLIDLTNLVRGEEPVRSAINLREFMADFFQSEAFRELKFDYPLVEVSTNFELFDGHFYGGPAHLETLLFHLARYSLRTQIHAQQIRISGRLDFVAADSLFHHQGEDGHYYILAVEDQGQGIRPEDLVEIFDPEQKSHGYADMKSAPKDLAVAWTILEDHGGALDLHSLAETTRLELFFPVTRVES